VALSRDEIIERIERSSRRLPLDRLLEVLDFVGSVEEREAAASDEFAVPGQPTVGKGLIEADGLLIFDGRPEADLAGAVEAQRERRLATFRAAFTR
jgi:hypothetical protein